MRKIIIASLIIAAVVLLVAYIQMNPPISEESGKEQACINSGGTVTTSLCCESTGNFSNMCLVGPCTCAPDYSHDVKICECPEGKCFDGNSCV